MKDDDPDDDPDDGSWDRHRADTLARIARALNVTTGAFFAAEPAPPPPAAETASRDDAGQALELMRLYGRLRSRGARDRCLAYIRGEVERGG